MAEYKMKYKWYRLRFRDGSVSGWTRDYEQTKKDAEFFRATIEEM